MGWTNTGREAFLNPEFAPAAGFMTSPQKAPTIRELLSLSESFQSAFQPIRDLRNGAVTAYEALIRFPESPGIADTGSAFRQAAVEGMLSELEFASLECHIRNSRSLPRSLLFLNVSAPLFLDARLRPELLLKRVVTAGLSPGRVVFELTEMLQINDTSQFLESLQALRREGFRLAVDDFGTGFNNLQVLIELAPEFLKIDASLVTGAAEHHRKRTFLEFLSDYGNRTGCAIIAEGLETSADVDTAKACGIRLGQGWALGRPASAATHIRIVSEGKDRASTHISESGGEAAGSISIPAPLVRCTAPVGSLIDLFERIPEPPAVVAEKDGRVTGLVTKARLFYHLGHQYGFSLWRDRPLQRFLEETVHDFDTISSSAAVEAASDLVRQRPPSRRFDPIVVLTENGSYHGVLPVDVLLTEITRLKVTYALHANPLTSLPGTVALRRLVDELLMKGDSFALGWVDIDNFKAFNDCYGFARGDDAILLAASTLRKHIGPDPLGLVVHPGGDDFAFIAAKEHAEEKLWAASLEFSSRARSFYRAQDLEKGCIRALDRQGVERRFGLLSISTGIVLWQGEPGCDYHRLVSIAAEVRKAAKVVEGPSVVVNRRDVSPFERDGGAARR
jgi:diguanylate cyclase (GGDEF)-like protein